jgi:uncharacterized damage-inducible protein DinB
MRTLLCAILLATASIAGGQVSNRQPSPGPITLVLGSSARQNVTWLTAAFDSIPASRYAFKPTPAQQTVGYIAQHLENANYQLCAKFGNLPYRPTAKDSLADTIKAQWPKDTLLARLRASFEFCQRAFATLTDANLVDELTPIVASTPGQTFPRARFVVLFVTDLVDHYSQIANYMRAMGMVPPSALPRASR